MHKSGTTFDREIRSAGLTMTSCRVLYDLKSRVLHRQFHVKQAHMMYVAFFLGTEN